MGKKQNGDNKSFPNPVADDGDTTSSAVDSSGGSSLALLALICGGIALVTALIGVGTAPSAEEFVSKAEYDALKASLQGRSTATETTVANLPTHADVAAAVATAASSADLAALQNELTTAQAQVAQLMAAHFMCANGYGGIDCTLDLTPPAIECPTGTISVMLSVDGSVTSADIPRPTALYDTGPGTADTLSVRLSDNEANVRLATTESTPAGTTLWRSATQPFAFSGPVEDNFALTMSAGDNATFFYSATDSAGNVASCSVVAHFVDADECNDGTHTCHADALCQNLGFGQTGGEYATGTYTCVCQDGFEGDGWSCEATEIIAQKWKVEFLDGPDCDAFNGQFSDWQCGRVGTYDRVGEIGLYDTHTWWYPSRTEAYNNGLLPLLSAPSAGSSHESWYNRYTHQSYGNIGGPPWAGEYIFDQPRAIKQLVIGSNDNDARNGFSGSPTRYLKLYYEQDGSWVLHSDINLLALCPNNRCVPANLRAAYSLPVSHWAAPLCETMSCQLNWDDIILLCVRLPTSAA